MKRESLTFPLELDCCYEVLDKRKAVPLLEAGTGKTLLLSNSHFLVRSDKSVSKD